MKRDIRFPQFVSKNMNHANPSKLSFIPRQKLVGPSLLKLILIELTTFDYLLYILSLNIFDNNELFFSDNSVKRRNVRLETSSETQLRDHSVAIKNFLRML